MYIYVYMVYRCSRSFALDVFLLQLPLTTPDDSFPALSPAHRGNGYLTPAFGVKIIIEVTNQRFDVDLVGLLATRLSRILRLHTIGTYALFLGRDCPLSCTIFEVKT